MRFDSIYTSPPGVEPQESELIVFAAVFEEEDWEELSLPRDALEYDSLYLGENEFKNLRAKWRDPIYLRSFFDENIEYFQTPYWKKIGKDRFVSDVTTSRPIIFQDFKNSCLNEEVYGHFEPLSKKDEKIRLKNEINKRKHQLVKLKSKYGYIINNIAFRIYAIEVDFNCFIITGGAIKLVEEMEQAPNTTLELRKILYLYNLLKDKGVTTKKDLFEIVL
ncbi:hypothetical protein SAMN06298214_0914 [Bacteroidales bacterium WCE2004]|nr:hypothetical protein SAMN06298214_0914 [Bacteroidales bacterium WCE2004]